MTNNLATTPSRGIYRLDRKIEQTFDLLERQKASVATLRKRLPQPPPSEHPPGTSAREFFDKKEADAKELLESAEAKLTEIQNQLDQLHAEKSQLEANAG